MVGGIGRAMLSGFNTNFRYRGVLFHVQTEDSGRDNPHVISHLFHGGNIMASQKRDYADLLGGDESEIEDAVRKLMEGQHKSMLKQLSRGEHDAAIAQRLGSDIFTVTADDSIEAHGITEDAPVFVVAEHTQLGAENVSAASFADDAILEPQFERTPDGGDAARTAVPEAPAQGADKIPPVAEETRIDAPDAEASQAAPASDLSRVFGDRVVSEKPLDEVVLDYLVDNARKRKRTSK